jgi:3-oxoacyl-[acyl-carrier protein] reductase
MSFGLAGRTIIVTGAAGGIGGATVRMAVENGMNVLAVDVAGEKLGSFVAGSPHAEAIAAHVADLTDTAVMPEIVRAAVERFGRVDGLVHAAGILRRQMEITDITEADWDIQVDVNQRGSWFLVREVAEALRRQGNGGSIVMVASAGAFTGGLGGSWVYASTKGAVVTMVRGFARTYAPHGIRVNAISPGTTNTEMLTKDLPQERLDAINAMVPMRRIAEPAEMASVALFLLSDWASYVAGVTLDVDGAWLTR